MKRFIDLRGQGTGSLFAWYETVRDEFETFDGSQDWNSWDEFELDFLTARPGVENVLRHYKSLLPDWVPETTPSEDEFDRIDKSRKGSV